MAFDAALDEVLALDSPQTPLTPPTQEVSSR